MKTKYVGAPTSPERAASLNRMVDDISAREAPFETGNRCNVPEGQKPYKTKAELEAEEIEAALNIPSKHRI